MTKIEALKKAGGKHWECAGRDRVYINNLEERAGLVCERYNSGNIRSATFRGEAVSNTEARGLSNALYDAKLFWDAHGDKWCWSVPRVRSRINLSAVMQDIVDAIEAEIAALSA